MVDLAQGRITTLESGEIGNLVPPEQRLRAFELAWWYLRDGLRTGEIGRGRPGSWRREMVAAMDAIFTITMSRQFEPAKVIGRVRC